MKDRAFVEIEPHIEQVHQLARYIRAEFVRNEGNCRSKAPTAKRITLRPSNIVSAFARALEVVSARVKGDERKILGNPVRVIVKAETREVTVAFRVVEQIGADGIPDDVEHVGVSMWSERPAVEQVSVLWLKARRSAAWKGYSATVGMS